jgi:hypothetical protein
LIASATCSASAALEQVARRTGGHGAADALRLGKARQRQDRDLRLSLLDGGDRGGAIHLGHHQVHQDDVRLQPIGRFNRLHSAPRR